MTSQRPDGPPALSLKRRVVRGAIWSIIGAGIAQVLTLATGVLAARMLGKEVFGEFDMIRSTAAMFGVFAGLGLGLTATKYIAELRSSNPARTGRIIALCVLVANVTSAVMAGTMFLIAPQVAKHILWRPHLVVELRIGCLWLYIETMIGSLTGTLAGFEAFRSIAWGNLVRGLFSFPLVVFGIRFAGLRGGIMGMAGAALVGWILFGIITRSVVRRNGIEVLWKQASHELEVLWKYSIPAIISGGLVGPVLWVAMVFLVRTADGYAQRGLYGAAYRFELPVTFLAIRLSAVVMPILSSLSPDVSGQRKSGRMLEGILAALVFIVLPSVAVLSCCSPMLVRLYGPKFAGIEPVLAAVLFVAAIKAFGNIGGTAIQSRGAMWTGLAINTVWAAALLFFVHRWAPYGAVAFANAIAVAYAIMAVAGLLYVALKRYVTWGLAGKIMAANSLVWVFTYGIEAVQPLPARLALTAAGVLIGLGGGCLLAQSAGKASPKPDLDVSSASP